ncbi:FadR/GntR family transcriptional regulator [Actinomycetes bacterium M1A6_2h]
MQQVRRHGLITQVTDQLREDIARGVWAVGSRIPTEPELCERTGTGRNTVREAVQALVHAGMLERRQGSGTYVVATSDVGSALGKYFAEARDRDVVELRRALDTTAAALAAERRDQADIAVLEDLLERRRSLWETDLPSALDADVGLHRAIVAASHNEVYLEVYDHLLPTIEQTIVHHVSSTGVALHDEHAALVRAIVDGRPDRAADAARCFFTELVESTHSDTETREST